MSKHKTRKPGHAARRAVRLDSHSRCGWIQAEVPGDIGAQSFRDHAAFFQTIHPQWWILGPNGEAITPSVLGVDGQGKLIPDPMIRDAANNARPRLQIWPMIACTKDTQKMVGFADQSQLVGILKAPGKHITNLLEELKRVRDLLDGNCVGIDIDYENLPDGLSSDVYTNFITMLVEGLHPEFQVSAAVPAVMPAYIKNGNTRFDYDKLSVLLDAIHVMAYDKHGQNAHHGPNCPAWDLKYAMISASGATNPVRFVFGMPNYGREFKDRIDPSDPDSFPLPDAPKHYADPNKVTTVDPHDNETLPPMMRCSFKGDDGIPADEDAGLQPNGQSANFPNGWTYFDTLESLESRVGMVADGVDVDGKHFDFGGVTYWCLGNELKDDTINDDYFKMVLRHFP